MTNPDLDARVAEAEAAIEKAHNKIQALCSGEERWTMRVPVDSERDHDMVLSDALLLSGALIRDLHAALQAREGGEFVECWGVFMPDGAMHSVRMSEQDAKWASTFYTEYGAPYTVRRLRCRVVEGE